MSKKHAQRRTAGHVRHRTARETRLDRWMGLVIIVIFVLDMGIRLCISFINYQYIVQNKAKVYAGYCVDLKAIRTKSPHGAGIIYRFYMDNGEVLSMRGYYQLKDAGIDEEILRAAIKNRLRFSYGTYNSFTETYQIISISDKTHKSYRLPS